MNNINREQVGRNYWIDCLRGYAILIVIISHLFYVEPFAARVGFLRDYIKGDVGVYIFYVLSGFLITGILDKEVKSVNFASMKYVMLRNFFMRRIFRLQPSYLLFLLCYIVFTSSSLALPIWVILFPISNWFAGPYITWHIKTLHIEETYYIIIGLICGLQAKSLKSILWFFLILGPASKLIFVVGVKLSFESANWFYDHYFPFDAFAMGGLLCLYLNQISKWQLVKWLQDSPAKSFLISMILIIGVGALRTVKPFSYPLVVFLPFLYATFSCALILSGIKNVSKFYSPKWIHKLGLVSYTVYLFQQFVFGPYYEIYGRAFSWDSWLLMLFALSVLVPIWYKFVEKPLADFGGKHFPRIDKEIRAQEGAFA